MNQWPSPCHRFHLYLVVINFDHFRYTISIHSYKGKRMDAPTHTHSRTHGPITAGSIMSAETDTIRVYRNKLILRMRDEERAKLLQFSSEFRTLLCFHVDARRKISVIIWCACDGLQSTLSTEVVRSDKVYRVIWKRHNAVVVVETWVIRSKLSSDDDYNASMD